MKMASRYKRKIARLLCYVLGHKRATYLCARPRVVKGHKSWKKKYRTVYGTADYCERCGKKLSKFTR